MSSIVINGENIYRARTTILQADILTLDTVPILLVPPIVGKSIAPVGLFQTYIYNSVGGAYVVGTGRAQAYYGNANTGSQPFTTAELINALVTGKSVSQFRNVALPGEAAVALTTVQGLGIYLVESATGFAATTGGAGSTIEIDVLYQVLPA